MMEIDELLPLHCVRRGVRAQSRKAALDMAADLIAACHQGVVARQLFDALMERERLGGTGIGEGVAVPHCRLECAGFMAALLHLEQAVDYDAQDGKPVDLVLALVVPKEGTDTHLQLLALLAKVFGDATNRARLRQTESAGALAAAFRTAFKRAQESSATTPSPPS